VSRPPFAPASDRDIEIVSAQLGRQARDVIGIPARCVCGAPTVVATAPRLESGTPFPTLYYLTHPAATASVSRLEADGVMARYQADLATDAELADAYRAAHESYLADREGLVVVAEIAGISAGGMPSRVKCLHALVGHSLSVGRGINPMGDRALSECDWSPEQCACAPGQRGSSSE
jgi:uncharacterized protein